MASELSRINRTKDKVHNDTNERLFNRDMIDINIVNNNRKNIKFMNRIDMERDEFLKNSNHNKNEDDDNNFSRSQRSNNFIFDDRRMPMRPEFDVSRDISRDMYNNSDSFPQSLDDIKKKSTKSSLLYFEKDNNFADINQDTKLSDNLQDNKICITGITNYGIFLFDNLLETMKCPFIFSPTLIYNIFGSLFIGSDGNTEVELKNYFNFPRSDVLLNGLTDISNIMNNHTSIRQGNCIIFSDNIDFKPQFCKTINAFTKIRRINTNNADKEAENINKIIKHSTGITKKSISANLLINSSIILLNYASISPIWTAHFSKTSSKDGIDFMHAFNQTFGYFEQSNLQVLEIMSTDKLCMGVIYGDIELSDKNIRFIISNLKPHLLEEVKIPKFKLQTKLKYTNILKETDLKTIFVDLKVPELFNDNCEITDCIQNIEFNFNENSVQTKKNTGYNTTRKFIVEKSFRFYLRSTINNCILFLGTF